MEILNETFFQYALISGVLLGVVCACIGLYIILRRIVFIGLALSEIASLGVALGLFLGWNQNLVALAATLLGTLFFWKPYKRASFTDESLIGFVYAIAAAVALILLTKNPAIEVGGIDLIGGNILYTTVADIWTLLLMAITVLAIHILFAKEFLFVSFDRETATTVGLKTNFYEFLLYISIGVVIALTMRVGGVIFVFGSLVIPPLVGLSIFNKTKYIFIAASLCAVISAIIGLFLSYFWDLPSSPAILCVYGIFFILANLVGPFKLSKLR